MLALVQHEIANGGGMFSRMAGVVEWWSGGVVEWWIVPLGSGCANECWHVENHHHGVIMSEVTGA